MMDKRDIRLEAIKEREQTPAETVEAMSAMVLAKVEKLPEYTKADIIASYVAKGREVQTSLLIEGALAKGKMVIVPKAQPGTNRLTFHEIASLKELSPGEFGVLEPPEDNKTIALGRAKLILVPVVAWDYSGGRLGYGKGFFDRELRNRGKAAAAGLAFESQRRPSLPLTRSDVPLDMVVTEQRVIRFGRTSFA